MIHITHTSNKIGIESIHNPAIALCAVWVSAQVRVNTVLLIHIWYRSLMCGNKSLLKSNVGLVCLRANPLVLPRIHICVYITIVLSICVVYWYKNFGNILVLSCISILCLNMLVLHCIYTYTYIFYVYTLQLPRVYVWSIDTCIVVFCSCGHTFS